MPENILKLDLQKEQSYKYLKCKQYDNAYREYRLIITDNHVPIALTGTEILAVYMEKPNGESVQSYCDYRNGFFYLKFYDWMLNVSGDATVEIKIYSSDRQETYGTMNFHVNIERSLLNRDALIKSNEFDLINYLMYQMNGAPELIEKINGNLREIEGKISKIQTDIDSYQKEFGELSSDAHNLIRDLTAIKAELLELDQTLTTNDARRDQNDLKRDQNDARRDQNDARREEAEAQRTRNENDRISKENERKSYEDQRIIQEQERQQGYHDVLETTDNAKHYIAEMDTAIQKSKDVTAEILSAADEITSKIPILDESLQKSEEVLSSADTFLAKADEVAEIAQEVKESKVSVEQSKQQVEDVIKGSLLESSSDILDQIKRYFERAEALYQSMTFDADGELPHQRAVTLVSIDGGGSLQERLLGGGGMNFDGGAPAIRLLGG